MHILTQILNKLVCLINDDIDTPNTSKHAKLIGRIGAHIQPRNILDYIVKRGCAFASAHPLFYNIIKKY